ncbi:MAG: TIGR03943 family protein [Propionicimonas sp.]
MSSEPGHSSLYSHGDGSGVPPGQTRIAKGEPGNPSTGSGTGRLPSRGGALPSTGLLLALIGSVATLWLAATGKLGLYIHPRYFTFTGVVVGLGLLATVAAHVIIGRQPADDHHDHDHPEATGWRARLRGSGSALAAVAVVLGLLVVPPSTLSTVTVEQRDLNSSVEADRQLIGADPASFALRDWAALLSHPSTALTYAGQQVTLSGFVTPAPDGNPDVFYLARFVVTCCTVDAQPVGIPVALAGWADSHPVDGWLQVTGTLVTSPASTTGGVVLKPTSVEAIEQPAQPYDY